MADFNQAFVDEEMLVSRYKDLEWIDDVSGFECARCGRVLIQHYIANCEHKFCSNCQKLMGDGSQRWRCPRCQQFINTIERQDFEFRDKVYELSVNCPNRKYGCPHNCPLKELKRHIEQCTNTREMSLPVPIEGITAEVLGQLFELRSEVKELRQMMMQMEKKCNDRDLDIHSRVDDIQSKINTKNSDKVSSAEEENNSKILKLDVKCDLLMNMLEMKEKNLQTELQNVKKQMENQDENIKKIHQSVEMIETVSKNNKTKIGKKFKKFEANTENSIKEMVNNLQMEKVEKEVKHSNRLFDSKLNEQMFKVEEKMAEDASELNLKIENVKETVEDLKNKFSEEFTENKTTLQPTQLNCFNLSEHNNSFSPDFRWKISRLEEKLEQTTFEIKSEAFQWAGYPVQSRAKLEVKDEGQVHLSLCFEGLNEEKPIDLKLMPQVYYVLRDQTQTNSPKHVFRNVAYLFTSKFKYSSQFPTTIAFKSHLNHATYNVDDSVVVDIHVESPTMAQQVHSYDGTLDWAINKYGKRKRMEKEGLVPYQESPYYYTGAKGYRVQVRMWLDGCGAHKGKGLTAEVLFWTGEFDADLSSAFPHLTTVTLFNRKDPQRNISKTIEKDIGNNNNYVIDVCDEEEMDSVIENDTLFYQVTIETIEKSEDLIFF